MKKKMKRMDRGGEVESRGDDDRMERRRMRRGDMEGRRKMMMDKIEGYRGKAMAGQPDMREKMMAAAPRMATNALERIKGAAPNPAGNVGLGALPQNMRAGMAQNMMNKMGPKPPVAPPVMKGGGLARKGVGQALKAGGMVRACGVAKRGKTKGKMV